MFIGDYMVQNQAALTPLERFQALLDGKKIRCLDWSLQEFIQLDVDGNVIDDDGETYIIDWYFTDEDIQWVLYA